MAAPKSLECRKFIHSGGADGRSSAGATKTNISVLQYNILADAAIPKGDSGVNLCGTYSYCPKSHRYMDSRHKRILAEISSLDADIVTMQEIEYDYYHNHIKAAMWNLGYTGVHHLRKTDHIGLTIFYKRDKFSLVSDDSFLIHTRADAFLERVGVNNKVAQVLQQHMKESATYPNILDPPGCLICKLRLREDNHTTICVGTTHITWKELKYPILQMLQGACVIDEMIKFSDGSQCILAGDFNTQPDMPLYKMITSGTVCDDTINILLSNNHFIDSKMLIDEKIVTDILKGIGLSAHLKSAYLSVMGKEPEVTNIDESLSGIYSGCLDYIWYSQGRIQPITVLDVPNKEELYRHTALPSIVFPSDHLPLYAKFRLQLAS